MLNELLSPDRILLDAPAATLEEATLLCGQLLCLFVAAHKAKASVLHRKGLLQRQLAGVNAGVVIHSFHGVSF